jgi:hypothetical protein
MARTTEWQHECEGAGTVEPRAPQGDESGMAWKPTCLLERTLVAYPEAFDTRHFQLLVAARLSILEDGDDEAKATLHAPLTRDMMVKDRGRIQCILEGLPSQAERHAPALLSWGEGLSIALAHRVPYAESALSIRLEVGSREGPRYLGGVRVSPTDQLLERWHALGHTAPPQSVWRCDPPERIRGRRDLVIELVPSPRGFNQAMLIGRFGAGRVLVPEVGDARSVHDFDAIAATVMPSGWTYSEGELSVRGGLSAIPIAAPRPSRKVRIPDSDLFALCAALTFPSTLRDAIWLRRRPDFRMLA